MIIILLLHKHTVTHAKFAKKLIFPSSLLILASLSSSVAREENAIFVFSVDVDYAQEFFGGSCVSK